MALKILVVQIRDQPVPRDQERECFRRAIGELGEVDFLNLASRTAIEWSDVDPADVLMVGGAGAHTVTETYDFTESLASVVRRWIEADRPFFGSCWGHHFLAWALGGSVVTDKASEEVGTYDVQLTAAGAADPLLAGLPLVFKGQLGHHDRIDKLPADAVELADSKRCRHQMLRLRDRPAYSTQFHAEMTNLDLRERLGMYADEYLPDRGTPTIEPSPEASDLLRRFLLGLG